MTDNQTGAQYYLVDVDINGTLYEPDGSEVTIRRNTGKSIDVLSNKRTILEYFASRSQEQRTRLYAIEATKYFFDKSYFKLVSLYKSALINLLSFRNTKI